MLKDNAFILELNMVFVLDICVCKCIVCCVLLQIFRQLLNWMILRIIPEFIYTNLLLVGIVTFFDVTSHKFYFSVFDLN